MEAMVVWGMGYGVWGILILQTQGLQAPGFKFQGREASVRSHVVWEDFLVLQVFLQRDAARHGGCEFDVVHQAGTGVASEVFFDDLFADPPNTGDKASDGCCVEERFHELVVRLVRVCSIFRVYF